MYFCGICIHIKKHNNIIQQILIHITVISASNMKVCTFLTCPSSQFMETWSQDPLLWWQEQSPLMMAHSDREFSNSHFPAIVEKYRGQESFENCKGSNFAKILTAVASGIACIKCNCCAYFWLQPVHTVKSFLGNLPQAAAWKRNAKSFLCLLSLNFPALHLQLCRKV